MRPVLSAKAMRRADERTIKSLGIPGFTLMESAGRAAALHIIEQYPAPLFPRITILCGKGNNGGDGFVCARFLADHHRTVQVVLWGSIDQLSDDARAHFDLLQNFKTLYPACRLAFINHSESANLPEADLYIDALLGTGLSSPLREPILSAVTALNKLDKPVIALDLPTGINTNSGEPMGAAVRAKETLTIAAVKTGLLLGQGPIYAGSVTTLNIGIPRFLLQEEALDSHSAFQLRAEDVRNLLPSRKRVTHKYEVGQTLVIAGSEGLSGAAVLASRAAARIGSGAVVCACPAAVRQEVAAKLTEVMTLSLPQSGKGLDPNKTMEVLEPILKKTRSILVGPGLGRNPLTAETVRKIIAETQLPTVIDADGIRALAGHMDWFSSLENKRIVLTPHAGEFVSLIDNQTKNRSNLAELKAFSLEWQCILLMKGFPSIVTCPDGHAFIAQSTSPSLATAGSGDVLAGTIAGLLAQGIEPSFAPPVALFLGGLATEYYAQNRHPNTLLAGDLIDAYPYVLQQLINA